MFPMEPSENTWIMSSLCVALLSLTLCVCLSSWNLIVELMRGVGGTGNGASMALGGGALAVPMKMGVGRGYDLVKKVKVSNGYRFY